MSEPSTPQTLSSRTFVDVRATLVNDRGIETALRRYDRLLATHPRSPIPSMELPSVSFGLESDKLYSGARHASGTICAVFSSTGSRRFLVRHELPDGDMAYVLFTYLPLRLQYRSARTGLRCPSLGDPELLAQEADTVYSALVERNGFI